MSGEPDVEYRPRSKAATAEVLAAELAERLESDLERGFTGHGPHRDELVLRRDGRELRAYGSRGQQRLGLLALLLAERDTFAASRDAAADAARRRDERARRRRRARLVEVLRAGGQSLTATDLAHVPGADDAGVTRLAIAEGAVLQEAA